MKAGLPETMNAATAKGRMTPISAVKPMSLPLAREMVMAQAMQKAEHSAMKSPNRWPVPTESPTMTGNAEDHHSHRHEGHRPRPLPQE